jgi:retinol dehydrogenase 14
VPAWSRSLPTRRHSGGSTSTTSRANGPTLARGPYNQSKLANVLFTYELARRLQGTSVTANALHPGVVRTSFGAEDPRRIQRLLIPFLRPFMKSPARGAATSIHLASAPELEQVTGRFFANSKPKRSFKRSYDEAVASRLWQVSADLVGLTAAG